MSGWGTPSSKNGGVMSDSIEETLLKGRLNGKQRNRLKRLLDMLYSPSELADEIEINKEQIYRVYIPLGCPNQRDSHNHIWINGHAFLLWYQERYKKIGLEEGETFCKTCRKPVKIIDGEKHTQGEITYLLSVCPVCGRKLTKILASSRGRG